MKKKTTVLESVAIGDAENFKISQRLLGQRVLLCEDLVMLYRSLGSTIMAGNPEVTIGLSVALKLNIISQHQLAVSCISVMQGRITDSFIQARRALEACGIARICSHDAGAAKIWLSTPLRERKPLMKRFSTAQMFPPDSTPDLAKLARRFDFCSANTHASLHSVASGFVRTAPDQKLFEFRHCEITHPSDVPRVFMWHIETHVIILRVFDGFFGPLVSEAWRNEQRGIEARVARHLESIGPLIEDAQRWREKLFSKSE